MPEGECRAPNVCAPQEEDQCLLPVLLHVEAAAGTPRQKGTGGRVSEHLTMASKMSLSRFVALCER